MRNSALGRRLGDLMEPRPAAGRPAGAPAAPTPEAEPRPSGVRLFLQPSVGVPRTARSPLPAPAPAPENRPAWAGTPRGLFAALLLADGVLCALAWFVVARSPGAVGRAGWCLVALAVALGAWLSVLAVRHLRPAPVPPRERPLNGAG